MKYLLQLIALAVIGGICFVIGFGINYFFFDDRTPVQPIEFSHKIHAGDNKIPCQYCHIYADKSKVSGVPNVQRCFGCHKSIKTDSPEIIKLTRYWDNKEPIPWVKVHNLPDFVHFTHKRHIKAGLQCAECHGDVASMPRITRVASLNMGWCLNCHSTKGVQAGMSKAAGKDCWTCHK